jgi:hypothetical protein
MSSKSFRLRRAGLLASEEGQESIFPTLELKSVQSAAADG